MDPSFEIRSGKHAGKTIEWLQKFDKPYLAWIKENRPEMLKGSEPRKPVPKVTVSEIDVPKSSLVPNLNFYNEGPADISIPYIKKMQEEKLKEKPEIDLDLLF